ncbi:MAG: hypothetical protein BEN19_04255 [Epulopiscium sp. Nuni2H_MBin003]|nr:MAG: hypothetical protein BEN19_04255 [Epulopiscium sp. Nuni2H_MBin003]
MKKKVIIASTILAYAFVEPYIRRIKKYKVEHAQVPPEFDGYKIAFLADIHFGRTINSCNLARMVDDVNRWKPDIVILGGDYVMDKKHIYPCFKQLAKLQTKQGIYAVMGNHDVVESIYDTKQAMKLSNIKSINNNAFWLKKGNSQIKLGGVGDLRTQRQVIEPTIGDTFFNDYIILVTHNPRYIYSIKEEHDINLILAGHTHGGQFSPLKHLSKVVPTIIDEAAALSYLSGITKEDTRSVIVSNGMGTAKFPLRIMTRPEMVFITLKRKNL